jgi:hypothetical protein
MGNYSNECPKKDPVKEKEKEKEKTTKDGLTATMTVDDVSDYNNWEDFNFHQSNHEVNPTWILLDNCSTTNIFCNIKLLTDIRLSKKTLRIHCNAATKEVNQAGTLRNYGTVWNCASAIANILSLVQVKHKFPISYDSKHGNQFVVNKPDYDVIFKESPSGLYYHGTANMRYVMLNVEKADMIETVKSNPEKIHGTGLRTRKECMESTRTHRVPITDRFQEHGTFKHDKELHCHLNQRH